MIVWDRMGNRTRSRLGTTLAAGLIVGLIVALLGATATAAPCKLAQVDSADKARLRVYFTKFVQEDNSSGKYKGCKIVPNPDPSAETFFVTPFRQDATVIVHKKTSWPG